MSIPLTKLNEIDVQGKLILIETISDIDQLFENLLSKGEDHEDVRDERIPYWADLWPSSIALSNYIIQKSIIQPGSKVLEIGCGVGLPGIVAGLHGAKVVFSDYIQEALDLAQKNWNLNTNLSAEFVRMDWREPDPAINADVILASDIAYEQKSFDDLIKAFRVLLSPAGKIIIAEPNRAFSQSFFSDLNKEGFKLISETQHMSFRGQNYNVHLHELELNMQLEN